MIGVWYIGGLGLGRLMRDVFRFGLLVMNFLIVWMWKNCIVGGLVCIYFIYPLLCIICAWLSINLFDRFQKCASPSRSKREQVYIYRYIHMCMCMRIYISVELSRVSV